MKTSRIVWTALPNFGDEKSIAVTLLASLIIQPPDQQDEIALENLPPLDDWPAAIDSITGLYLRFIGENGRHWNVAIADCETSFQADEASRVWRALFPGNTVVGRYRSRFKGYGVRSYGAHPIENALRELYVRSARLSPEEYPDRDTWKSILDVLTADDLREFERMRHYFDDLNEPRGNGIPDRRGEPDFNVILSSLSAYPVLQRKVGLAIDVRIRSLDGMPIRGTVGLAGGAPPANLPFRVHAPTTEYIMEGSDSRLFQAFDRIGKRPLNGLLPINNKRYAVSSIHVELNATFFHDAVRGGSDDDARECRLPAFTSGGISLLDKDGEQHLLDRLARTLELEQLAAEDGGGDDDGSSIGLDLNDIGEGLRVDVFDEKTSTWLSLCQRDGEYRLGSGDDPVVIGPATDEGTATRAAAEPLNEEQPGRAFFISPALFEWDGWSLCVDLPESPADTSSGTCKIDVAFRVPPRSLPRLRFRTNYRMRVRTVDLAGNSIPMETANEIQNAQSIVTTRYRRIDPIASPRLIPAEPLQTDRGDSEDVFILRSNYNVPAVEYMSQHHYSIPVRHIAPPEVEQKFAEKHGVFDRESGLDPEAYETIKQLERGFDDSIGPEATDIPYLGDPLAARFQLRVLDHRIVESYPAEMGWPHVRTCLLRLEEGPTGFGATETEYTVSLEKATVTAMRISSGLAEDANPRDLLLHAEWANSLLPADRINEGDYWLTTPYRTIMLVHAVQQPLQVPLLTLAETRSIVGPRRSSEGDTSVYLEGSLEYHGQSTGSVDVFGKRMEWRDDPAVGPPAMVAKNDNILSEVIPVTGERIVFDGSTQVLLHDFEDTKQHLVRYWAVATSRFQEYFPQNEQLDFTRISNEDDVAARSTVRRLSTARPPKPEIAYAIPIFRFALQSGQDVIESRREALALRVYLERPWFESGDEERLGLVMSSGSREEVMACAWGIDPTHASDGNLRPLAISNLAAPRDVVRDEVPGSEGTVDIALYEVVYDEARGLWYADVRFVDAPSYMPFVRLSVLRYQPWSLEQLHASELAPAEFIQMLNDRTCTVSATGNDGGEASYTVNTRGVELKTVIAFFQARNIGDPDIAWQSESAPVELRPVGNDAKSAAVSVEIESGKVYRLVVYESESNEIDPSSLACRQTHIDHFELGELARCI